jgi:26S proteasome regulatory subunit N8
VNEDGQIVKNFIHVPSSIGASEAEQVGVEHLLRDVKDVSIGTLSKEVGQIFLGNRSLIK